MAKKTLDDKNVSPIGLKIMFTIVPRNKGEMINDTILGYEVNTSYLMQGIGTADDNLLKELGLSDKNKAVIVSIVKETKIKEIEEALIEKFNTIKGAKGISWTVPISSVIGVLIFRFLSNNKNEGGLN